MSHHIYIRGHVSGAPRLYELPSGRALAFRVVSREQDGQIETFTVVLRGAETQRWAALRDGEQVQVRAVRRTRSRREQGGRLRRVAELEVLHVRRVDAPPQRGPRAA